MVIFYIYLRSMTHVHGKSFIEVAANEADSVPLLFINARPDHTRYRSLTDTQLQIIRTPIRPGAAENPFPDRMQLRNWLMIELVLETEPLSCHVVI
jgi:hypothetical protein